MTMNIPFRRVILLCLITLITSAAAQNAYTEQRTVKTVRVGYYENEVFQEGAKKDAVRTGYAYEYYRKLSEYTGWKYQYIYGSYGELYTMLLNGQIDLLAGLAWKKDREGLIGYPQAAMGNETYSLVKHETDTDITIALQSLNGKKIGVLDSAVVDVLARFLLNNNIKASIITYQAYNDLFDAFDSHKVDILAAEGDGAYKRAHAEVLCPFGESEYYLCVNIKRPDLLQELNDAQTMLSVYEPHYIHSLQIKYYSLSVSSSPLSEAERKWREEHTSINVGYMNNYMPYSDTDKSGKTTGLVQDIMPTIMQRLGINDITINYIPFDSYSEMLERMKNSEIDVVFPTGGSQYYSEESGINQSSSVTSTPPILICRSNDVLLDFNAQMHFAANEKNNMQYYYIRTNFPNAKISFFSSIEECLDAVLEGAVDCMTINGLRNEMLRNRKYRRLTLIPLNISDSRCFGVEIGNEGLLKLLNRGINAIGSDYAQNIAYKYTSKLYSYSFKDAILDNMLMFVLFMLVFAGFIIYFVVRDAKRSKAALTAAEHANRAKTVFLNNMSHDIRTPMNAIVGFTTLAQGSLEDKEKLSEYLSKIAVSSQHMLSLINDVLDMSRIESGKVTLDETTVNLTDLINDIQTIIQANLTAKQHHFTVNIDIRHEYVMADKMRLNQILLNILSNAIKFTPDGGQINMTVKEFPAEEDSWTAYTFCISDNGIGMSQKFRSEIFEAFSREESSTVSGIEGTGLGMAITKKLIDMMGGKIEVNSCEGNGSEFIVTISFKICDAPAKQEELTKHDVDFTGKRVLLAEDVETNQIIAVALLEQIGFQVEIASDGKQAVEMVNNAEPGYYDIVLMDIQMPHTDGYEATKLIRSLDDPVKANIPIAAVTANAFVEDKEAALNAGMNAHLAKPYDMEQIIRTMQILLK
ncbi:MAG: transporter substrate-binding domain-containing protein [Spirochaetales bacterium]|nr:transporter substrate-binding domain-containing protein [Spirochaetales bacterium]